METDRGRERADQILCCSWAVTALESVKSLAFWETSKGWQGDFRNEVFSGAIRFEVSSSSMSIERDGYPAGTLLQITCFSRELFDDSHFLPGKSSLGCNKSLKQSIQPPGPDYQFNFLDIHFPILFCTNEVVQSLHRQLQQIIAGPRGLDKCNSQEITRPCVVPLRKDYTIFYTKKLSGN